MPKGERSLEQLLQERTSVELELINLVKNSSIGANRNVHVRRNLRRRLAAILTQISEIESAGGASE